MKTVIEMARSVGATAYTNRHYPDRPTHTFNVDQLEVFSELVRADERARMVEQPAQQEPVAWTLTEELEKRETTTRAHLWFSDPVNCMWTPLYTSPPAQRTWVGLTDEEIWETVSRIGTSDSDVNPYTKLADARAIEAKLKEKNT